MAVPSGIEASASTRAACARAVRSSPKVGLCEVSKHAMHGG